MGVANDGVRLNRRVNFKVVSVSVVNNNETYAYNVLN